MKEVLNIENLQFVSINDKYTKSRTTGRLILTEEYRSFRDEMGWYAKKGRIEPPYKLIFYIKAPVDISNSIKAIEDGLELAGVLDNDENIEEEHIYKKKIKKGRAGSLRVLVGTIDELDKDQPESKQGIA